VAEQVQAIRQTTAPAPDRGATRPDPVTTIVLVPACAQHRQVQVRYRSGLGSKWDTTVDPWAVVVRHGRWYLLCHSARAAAVRAYRVDLDWYAEQLAVLPAPFHVVGGAELRHTVRAVGERFVAATLTAAAATTDAS